LSVYLVEVTDLMLCKSWVVQPVISSGITCVIQHEHDAAGIRIFCVLNELLYHMQSFTVDRRGQKKDPYIRPAASVNVFQCLRFLA